MTRKLTEKRHKFLYASCVQWSSIPQDRADAESVTLFSLSKAGHLGVRDSDSSEHKRAEKTGAMDFVPSTFAAT